MPVANIDERYTGDDYATHNEDWHEGNAGWTARQVAEGSNPTLSVLETDAVPDRDP